MFFRDGIIPKNYIVVIDEKIGLELIDKGFPLLTYSGDNYVFAKTREITKAIKKINKIKTMKGGDIYQ